MATENITQLTPQTGSANTTSLLYAVTGAPGNYSDTSLPLSVFVNNLGLTGTPTVPTATTGTNTTQIASTAFVQAQLTSSLAPYALKSGNLSQFASTTSAQLAGIISDKTGSGSLVFGTSPTIATPVITGGSINNTPIGATTANTGAFTTLSSIGTFTPSTTAGIVGTTLADNANAGSVGEYVTSNTVTTSASSGVPLNAAAFVLAPGDWEVTGIVQLNPAGTTTTNSAVAGISTVSATFGTVAAGINNFQLVSGMANNTGVGVSLTAPVTRINASTATTVYLIGQAGFAVSTMTISGFIRARRVR